MAARPSFTVFSSQGESSGSIAAPKVFNAPVRIDIVQQIHKDMAKNKRQAYATKKESKLAASAGMNHSAESWGTGRAVARIPRISGSGTATAGAGAFGNMCRGGRMFAPTKTWRKWHVKINQNQRRYAVASALAASANTSLVLARGHRVEEIQEVPLVVSNDIQSIQKTKAAVEALKTLKAYNDIVKVAESRKLRAGKGKWRNRRHTQRRGPLVVYNKDEGLVKAFRNVPGVETCPVQSLNLLQLAPGGHVGRFIIWTEGAMGALDEVYAAKSGFEIPTAKITLSDVSRAINSDELQSVARPAGQATQKRPFTQKKNPLKNKAILFKLNPYAKTLRKQELERQQNKAVKKSAPGKVAGEAFKETLFSA